MGAGIAVAPAGSMRFAPVLSFVLIGCGSPVEEGRSEPTALEDSAVVEGGSSVQEDSAVAKCVLTPGSSSSKWAAIGADGTLQYAKTAKGDRLLDFSWAGYEGGGVALPTFPVEKTVKPTGGDDTATIQAAIDEVSKLPLAKGVRGAVLLEAGTFKASGVLRIRASGVVLRGSGASSTSIVFSGTPRDVIEIAGSGSWSPTGNRAQITDDYVPSGTRTFHVDDATGFAVGDPVLVDRPVTSAWIKFMGMDTLVRDGKPQTWLSAGTVIHADRVITAIDGKQITIDAPISDSFDSNYTNASMVRYAHSGRIDHVGLESLHLVAPKNAAPISIAGPTYRALRMDAVINGWVRDVDTDEFISGLIVEDGAKWITIEDVNIRRTNAIDGSSGWPFHLSVAGQQTLTHRVQTSGADAFPYATQARDPGPNVLLGLVAKSASRGAVQPHQRWGTGLLVDSSQSQSIDLRDRGIMGSGHGWTMGFGVVWNSTADTFLLQQPPGAMNWGIGLIGKIVTDEEPGSTYVPPTGTIDSLGKPVAPKSLYLAQLCLRLGPQAVKNIGY